MNLCFDPNLPEGIKLYDIVDSVSGVFVINKKVKELCEDLKLTNVECLPVELWDHTDSKVDGEFFILNVLGCIDAIDMEKSEYRMGRIIKTQISRIKNLVLDVEAIPKDLNIFRPTTKFDEFFVSDAFKAALEDAGITGWAALPADGWDGMDF